MDFPYEKEAKSGAPMPDGLSAAGQVYYQALALLATRYRFGAISAENSVREKRLLENQYLNMKSQEKYISLCANFWADVENAVSIFAKEQTIENAHKMYEAIYGCVLKKREAISE